jgi:hypothetical protein
MLNFFSPARTEKVTCPHSVLRNVFTPICWPGCGRSGDLLPGVVVRQEHAVVLPRPSLAAISPVHPGKMKDFPQRDQFIRFGDRFAGILVQKKFGALLCRWVPACRQIPAGLPGTPREHPRQRNLKSSGEVPMALVLSFLRAMSQEPRIPFGPLLPGPQPPGIVNQLGNVDLHRTDINTPLAHGTHPRPVGLGDLFVHAQGGHSQKLARIHAIQPVAGHPEEHAPQVRQRFRLPPSGRIPLPCP